MAYVVIQHLDPTHKSHLIDLLGKITPMPVSEIRKPTRVEPGHVYVIAPGQYLEVRNGVLYSTRPAEPRGRRLAVDHFFRSLAEDQMERAIAIVLSGSGSDGTLGARAIKAAGGIVLAETPESAGHDGMPRSVIAMGIADFVVPPGQMPGIVETFSKHSYVQARTDDGREPDHFGAVLALLRARTRFDFRGYKKNTLRRRVARRMSLQRVDSLAEYLDLLRNNGAEVAQLRRDLLIGVTHFFRDPQAWDELRSKVVARLISECGPDRVPRIWVPGCSTGEEAYSLALLLQEQMTLQHKPFSAQIFATDVDERAIELARAGVYPESIAADVKPPYLKTFFTHEGHTYRIRESVREAVVFATQNVLTDPPFSRLDLIACRNLLIYLKPDVQKRVLDVFHFALNPGGHLFLGSSENPGSDESRFRVVSKTARIYQRIGPSRNVPAEVPVFPAINAESGSRANPTANRADLGGVVRQLLLDHHDSAAVIVNLRGEILHLTGPIATFLDLPSGSPDLNLFAMAPDPVRGKLRAAVHRAAEGSQPTTIPDITFRRNGDPVTATIAVKPIPGPSAVQGLILVVFRSASLPPTEPVVDATEAAGPAVARLEAELKTTRQELQSTIEQLETSIEELKASNKEVISINEELQSTKEELQSMDEELSTVNSQLEGKLQELTEANNDLNNLLASTDLATVFLDAEFKIRRFTPAAHKLLNLLPSDVGRPVRHLAQNLIEVDLVREGAVVLNTLTPVRREVRSPDGHWYLITILPYRTAENVISGVVVTYSDITDLKQTEDRIRRRERQQQHVADLGRLVLSTDDLDRILRQASEGIADGLGVELGGVFMRRTGAGDFELKAGVGWGPGAVGSLRVGAKSLEGMTAVTEEPILVEEASQYRPIVKDDRIHSGVSVLIPGREGAHGAISAYSVRPRQFSQGDVSFLKGIANTLAETIEYRRNETRLRQTNESLEKQVRLRTRWLALLQDITRAANEAETLPPLLAFALQRLCQHDEWKCGHAYLPDEKQPKVLIPGGCCYPGTSEKLRKFRLATLWSCFERGSCLPGKVYKLGRPVFGVDMPRLLSKTRATLAEQAGLRSAVGFPVRLKDEVVAVLELFSEQVREPSGELLEMMSDLGSQLGRVVERRRLQMEFAEGIMRRHRDLGQELHDGLGQDLTALVYRTRALTQKLTKKERKPVETIAKGLLAALRRMRSISKRLFPSEIRGADLVPSLRELATDTRATYPVSCRFEGNEYVRPVDAKIASHLLRIAQEAVLNSVKHAKPKHIVIGLRRSSDSLVLTVRDDGRGFPKEPRKRGTGLKIMEYRASLIGGALTIVATPSGGTVVTCTVPTVRFDASKENS